jgi:hypothetical protein
MLPANPPNFDTVFEVPTSYVGPAPLPNQVEYFNSLIMWASSTFQVFGLMQTKDGFAPHTPYYLSDGQFTSVNVGFLKNLNGNILFAGFQSGNGFEIIGATGDGTGNSVIQSLGTGPYIEERSAIIDVGYRVNIKKAIAMWSNFGSTSSAYISLIPNRTPYSLDSNNHPVGDVLGWTINTTNHPRITTTFTSSTSELAKNQIANDMQEFWINIRYTNTDKSAPPPILRSLTFICEPTDKP